MRSASMITVRSARTVPLSTSTTLTCVIETCDAARDEKTTRSVTPSLAAERIRASSGKRLRQPQYDPEHQKRKEDTLSRVDDDAHPCATQAPARVCEKEDTANGTFDNAPRLVNMVEAKEHAIGHPTPPAKYS